MYVARYLFQYRPKIYVHNTEERTKKLPCISYQRRHQTRDVSIVHQSGDI